MEGKVSSGYNDLVVLDDGQEANWEVVERILFIYAKLNPGHSYVQACTAHVLSIVSLFLFFPLLFNLNSFYLEITVD